MLKINGKLEPIDEKYLVKDSDVTVDDARIFEDETGQHYFIDLKKLKADLDNTQQAQALRAVSRDKQIAVMRAINNKHYFLNFSNDSNHSSMQKAMENFLFAMLAQLPVSKKAPSTLSDLGDDDIDSTVAGPAGAKKPGASPKVPILPLSKMSQKGSSDSGTEAGISPRVMTGTEAGISPRDMSGTVAGISPRDKSGTVAGETPRDKNPAALDVVAKPIPDPEKGPEATAAGRTSRLVVQGKARPDPTLDPTPTSVAPTTPPPSSRSPTPPSAQPPAGGGGGHTGGPGPQVNEAMFRTIFGQPYAMRPEGDEGMRARVEMGHDNHHDAAGNSTGRKDPVTICAETFEFLRRAGSKPGYIPKITIGPDTKDPEVATTFYKIAKAFEEQGLIKLEVDDAVANLISGVSDANQKAIDVKIASRFSCANSEGHVDSTMLVQNFLMIHSAKPGDSQENKNILKAYAENDNLTDEAIELCHSASAGLFNSLHGTNSSLNEENKAYHGSISKLQESPAYANLINSQEQVVQAENAAELINQLRQQQSAPATSTRRSPGR